MWIWLAKALYWNSIMADMSEMHTGAGMKEQARLKKLVQRMLRSGRVKPRHIKFLREHLTPHEFHEYVVKNILLKQARSG